MKLKILVTAGDGIGPEVTNEAVAVLREVAELGGHTLEIDAKRIGGVAIVKDGTPLPGRHARGRTGQRRGSPRRCGRQRIQFPSSRTSVPKPDCCSFAPRSADSPICALPSHSRNSPSTARFALRSLTAPTFSSFANCSAVFTSASRASGTATTGEAWNTMRYTRDEVARVARIAFQLASQAPQEAHQRRQGQRA